MMGKKERSFAQLLHVSVEELVPADHFYRHLERTLDFFFVRAFVQESYANKGRPSMDPVVFFKLQVVMFFEDIRSERLLMRLVADRLSVRWYLGYDLDDPLPDHWSLSRIRTRYGLDVFRRFFDASLEQCQQAKLIWGKERSSDATNVDANASVDSLTTRFAVEAREALHTHVGELFQEENDQQTSVSDPLLSKPPPHRHPSHLSCLKKSKKRSSCNRLLAMIAMPQEGSNNVRCEGSISGVPISGSASLIQMRLPCDRVGDRVILAIKPTRWSMEDSSG